MTSRENRLDAPPPAPVPHTAPASDAQAPANDSVAGLDAPRNPHPRRAQQERLCHLLLLLQLPLPHPNSNTLSPRALPAAGLAQLYESGRPNANYFAGLAQSLGIAYTSSVIGLNVIVTALICGRIYFASRRYAHVLGIDVGDEYRSATAIIVESALLYTLTGVAYLISFALDSQTSIFFLSVYVMMTVRPSSSPFFSSFRSSSSSRGPSRGPRTKR